MHETAFMRFPDNVRNNYDECLDESLHFRTMVLQSDSEQATAGSATAVPGVTPDAGDSSKDGDGSLAEC